jgi:hypothetical protein
MATGGNQELVRERTEQALMRAEKSRAQAESAARLRSIREQNAERTRQAHAAAMAADWRPSLTPDQLRDALARSRWARARERFSKSVTRAAAQQ